MRVCTVLDARRTAPPGYPFQTLLLAHSWAATSKGSSLEVVVIGTAPPPVEAQLRELGAVVTRSGPHRLDAVARSANKLLGLRVSGDTSVLLVDNDVCFLDDVADVRGRNVCASVASKARITDAQWAHMEQATGLRPLALEWVPLHEELEARKEGRTARTEQRLYLNGGVVWIRRPVLFESIWAAHIDAIARAFDGHPASTLWVRGFGSDQAGLATAVAEQGGFDLLPCAYNMLPACLRLGTFDEPKILHLARLGARAQLPFAKAFTAWWEKKIVKPMTRPSQDARSHGETDPERERLLEQAVRIRDRVLRLAADAGLNAHELNGVGTSVVRKQQRRLACLRERSDGSRAR